MISWILSGSLGSSFHLLFRKRRLYLSHSPAVSRECVAQGPAAEREQKQTPVPGFAPKFWKPPLLWLEKKLSFSEFWVLQSTAAHVQENGEKREEEKKENWGIPPSFSDFPTSHIRTREHLLETALCPIPISEFQASLSLSRAWEWGWGWGGKLISILRGSHKHPPSSRRGEMDFNWCHDLGT